MTQIDISPIVLKDVLLQIGADNYEKNVSSVTLTPTAATVNWNGMTPDASFTDVARATWTCGLAYAQDWATTDSLSRYLFDHEGETVSATFQPQSGVGDSFAVSIVITPGAIGGAVNAVAVATVTLGMKGRPEIIESGTAEVPTVAAIAPATGDADGGDLVKLTGSGFTSATTVSFGDTDVTDFEAASDTTIYLVTPAVAAGDVDVTVTNSVGESTTSVSFTFA